MKKQIIVMVLLSISLAFYGQVRKPSKQTKMMSQTFSACIYATINHNDTVGWELSVKSNNTYVDRASIVWDTKEKMVEDLKSCLDLKPGDDYYIFNDRDSTKFLICEESSFDISNIKKGLKIVKYNNIVIPDKVLPEKIWYSFRVDGIKDLVKDL